MSSDLPFLGALHPEAQTLLPRLAARSWATDFYLAGSAAVALHLGHRPVRSLDLMSAANRLRGTDRRDLLADLQALDPGIRVETARDGYLFARSGAGVTLKFFHYPYPLVGTEESALGLGVASLLDLGLMKLAAIISRGERRDFVDLFLLCRALPLEHILAGGTEKFGHVGDFALQALKGLADLADAEAEPMPRLALPLEWTTVADWLRHEVVRLGAQHVGLEPGALR